MNNNNQLADALSIKPIFKESELSVSVFVTDHAGTPLKLLDQYGQRVWEAAPDDWGAVTGEKWGSQPLRFQGQYFDEESGFYYNRYRYYDPQYGRYITQDPIGLAGGMNAYVYPTNPVEGIDPLGLEVTGVFNKTTGMLNLVDKDTGVTKQGEFFSGGAPYGEPIPNGEWDILEQGRKPGFFRLEAKDTHYGDDKHEETGRNLFRLHKNGNSIGCITAKKDTNWNEIEGFIKGTETDTTCLVPSDSIPMRSWPLFQAERILRSVIEFHQHEESKP